MKYVSVGKFSFQHLRDNPGSKCLDRSQAQHWRHRLLPELSKFVLAFKEATISRLFSSCTEKGNRCKLALQIRFISKIFGLTFCNYHEKLRVCEGRCRMQILDLGRLQEFWWSAYFLGHRRSQFIILRKGQIILCILPCHNNRLQDAKSHSSKCQFFPKLLITRIAILTCSTQFILHLRYDRSNDKM